MKTTLLFLTTLLIGSLTLPAQYTNAELEMQWEQVWSDPVFVEKFLRTYGALSDEDPKVSKDEVKLFRELMELFTANPSAAAARLQEELEPDSSAAMNYTLATLYFQEQDLEQAETYYTQAIAKHRDYRNAHKNLAIVHLMQDKKKEARKHMHRAIELGEKDGRLFGLLGYTYLADENYLAAEAAYSQAILLEPDMLDWKLGLAQSLLGMEKFSEAHVLFEKLIEQDPNKPDYWRLQVNTYLGLDRPQEAIANLEVLRRMGQIRAPSMKLLGDIYMSLGMTDQSLRAYSDLIEMDENSIYLEPSLRIGKMLIATRDYDRAFAMLETIEVGYPNLADEEELNVLVLKAKVARAQGNETLAVETLETVINRDALNGDALLEIAAIYAAQSKYEEAVIKYESAAKITGFEHQALAAHGRMLVKQKDYAAAVPLLKESLEYKNDQRIAEYLAKVERVARSKG